MDEAHEGSEMVVVLRLWIKAEDGRWLGPWEQMPGEVEWREAW